MRYTEKTVRTKPVVEKWITDKNTGLSWAVFNKGKKMKHEDAFEYAKSLGKGWRVPDIKELIKVIDYKEQNPATGLPEILSTGYWSASTYVPSPTYAWYVHMNYGYVYNTSKTNSYQVVCVHDNK